MASFFPALRDRLFCGSSSPYYLFKLITDNSFRLVHEWRKLEFSFDIQLVEHCDLGCQMCQHFSNIAKPEIYAPTEYAADLEILARILRGQKFLIKLVGGEPLLHPELEKMIFLSKEICPTAMILLITNGIRLPHLPDTFWQACRECSVIIRCSTYPIPLDWPTVIRKAKRAGVPLVFQHTHAMVSLKRPLTAGEDQFTSGHWVLDLEGMQDIAESFSLCHMKHCITLMNGMLGHCSISARIRHFNAFFKTSLANDPEDFLKLKPDLSPDDLRAFAANPIPFCRFCNVKAFTYGHPFALTRKDITEWTQP